MDFQLCQTSLRSGGPREPWHDIHAKIEGSCVKDVVTNFVQRWRRAVRFKKARLHLSSDLKPLLSFLEGVDPPVLEDEGESEAWNIQVRHLGRFFMFICLL